MFSFREWRGVFLSLRHLLERPTPSHRQPNGKNENCLGVLYDIRRIVSAK